MPIYDNSINSLLELGLKAEGLRQQAIANNVANLQTPGYKRTDVRFEDVLSKAIERSEPLSTETLEPTVYEPQNCPINEHGNNVSLDTEVGLMIKNSIRHKTIAMLLKKRYQMMDAAIKV